MRFFTRLQSLHTLTDETGPLAALLRSRSVLRFTGPDTLKFLNGLLTNDVAQLGTKSPSSSLPTPNSPVQSAPILYAALLTPQGRFLYDLFLYKQPNQSDQINRFGSGPGESPSCDEVFADVDSDSLDELLATLKRYQLRSKVEIESVGGELSCWQRFGPQVAEKSDVEEPEATSVGWGACTDLCAMASTHANDSRWQWFKDPRLRVLGLRGIFPSDKTPPLVEADKESDESHYLLWRMQHGVAEGPFEIPKGEAIPLEYNMAGLNAISFEKGCYVGQELIARTHHRGVVRKRLVPMVFRDGDGKESEQSVVVGAQVVGTGGTSVGTVSTVLGCRGMGLLRLEDAFGGSSLSIGGREGVKVSVIKPQWWPSDWLSFH